MSNKVTESVGHKELEAYFRRVNADRIIPKIEEKETPTMFEQLKTHFLSLWTKPVQFVEGPIALDVVPDVLESTPEDYWVFKMCSSPWYDSSTQEDIPGKVTRLLEETNGTWMEQLDKILDVMSEHYGYDIKEQVYYSVAFPLNIEGEAGYGRCLNDERLQQILLAFPELYLSGSWGDSQEKSVFK